MARSFDNLWKNVNKLWIQFRWYFVRGLYYGCVPSMFIIGKV